MGKNTAGAKKKTSASSPSSPKKWNWTPGTIVKTQTGSQNNKNAENLDLCQTLVDGVFIGFCTRSWSNKEASYVFPLEKGLSDAEDGQALAKQWKHVFGFLPRRDLAADDGKTAMKTKVGSKWDWKVVVVVIKDEDVNKAGRHLASCFSKFTRNNAMGKEDAQKYTYRQCYSNDPKSLNHYLLDLDVAKILKSFLFEHGDYGSKEELAEDEELMTEFFGTPQYGKEFLEDMEDDDWENL